MLSPHTKMREDHTSSTFLDRIRLHTHTCSAKLRQLAGLVGERKAYSHIRQLFFAYIHRKKATLLLLYLDTLCYLPWSYLASIRQPSPSQTLADNPSSSSPMTTCIPYSTVPAAHDVLVPETLLKKRKSDAKAREEKAAKAAATKKVSISLKINAAQSFCRTEISGIERDYQVTQHMELDVRIMAAWKQGQAGSHSDA